jgi:serine/threonine-protein kinase
LSRIQERFEQPGWHVDPSSGIPNGGIEAIARPGDVLAGKYRVERVLGAGGMGVVIAAKHLRLDELVAIKLLHPDVAHRPEIAERFAREARAASKIQSAHVARVSDVDSLPDGSPYMVMEHLDGCDLAQYIRSRGALPVEQAVGFVLQACEAVAEAHSLGIVHRDLKPANLFLARRRDGSTCIKVLDFGISKVVDRESGDGAVTRTKAVIGSPSYMSPEHMLSARDVDGRADIWALGVVLYEMLAGRVPFRGDTLPETCALVLQASPEPIRNSRSDVPGELEAVVARCLQKDRAHRFASVAELAVALVPFGLFDARLSADRAVGVLAGSPRATLPLDRGSNRGAAPGTLPVPSVPTERLPDLAGPEPARVPTGASPLSSGIAAPSYSGTSTTSPGPAGGKAPVLAGIVVVACLALGAALFALRAHRASVNTTERTPGPPAAAAEPSPAVTMAPAGAAPPATSNPTSASEPTAPTSATVSPVATPVPGAPSPKLAPRGADPPGTVRPKGAKGAQQASSASSASPPRPKPSNPFGTGMD